MSGDYSRLTFDPRRDHAGVLMQQGRVQLDSDWNELVELLDRRLRAETTDVIGRAVVPRETPDGFRIEASGGTLTIGRGRMYVDGLLAENHGAGADEYDPVLGEVRGADAIPYTAQPYLPEPPPLPEGGPHLVYLDVWQREVTALEDPGLVEKAVGVDTATRLQTVWQVRLLEVGQGATCEADLPGWDDLVRPSGGRLTTTAVGVPAPDDDCTIPAAGGYRGTENRLYRVEVHQGGALGAATFKWARHNASISTPVTAIDAAGSELTVVRTGRDAVLRFDPGTWVEVTDDVHELAGEPGVLAKVQSVDDVRRTLTLTAALPPGELDATDPARHTRVRRWDQAGAAVDAAGGLLTVDAAPLVLEDGVQIAFGGGDFRAGDHWVFAARTADASVEELVDAPPRGIHHHYARLALVTFPDDDADCRVLWPPEPAGAGCECTVCVSEESHASGALTLQRAIDEVVARGGGKVCVEAGTYRLAEGLRIRGARSLKLAGAGWRTMLLARGTEPAIAVESSIGVGIEELTVVTSSVGRTAAAQTGGTAVALHNCLGVTVQRCVLLQSAFLRKGTAFAALAVAPEAALASPRGGGGPAIGLDGFVLESFVRENVVGATSGIGGLRQRGATTIFRKRLMETGATLPRATRIPYLLTNGLYLDDNVLLCDRTGIALEGYALHAGETRVAGNVVRGCTRGGIVASGLVAPGARLDVRDNTVNVRGDAIFVGCDDATVSGNHVSTIATTALPSLVEAGRTVSSQPSRSVDAATTLAGSLLTTAPVLAAAATQPAAGADAVSLVDEAPRALAAAAFVAPIAGAGIVLGPGLGPTGIDRCRVADNRIVGITGTAISIRTRVRSALVEGNLIAAVGGGGIVMEDGADGGVLRIEGNQLLDVGLAATGESARPAGIRVLQTSRVDIGRNTVAGVGARSVAAAARAGIEVSGCASVQIAGNDVSAVGPLAEFANEAAGIAVTAPFDRLDVVDNVVRRAAARPESPGRSDWTALRVGAAAEDVTRALASLAFFRRGDFEIVVGNGNATVFPRGREIVAVRGNLLDAFGALPAVSVGVSGTCLLTDNRCLLASGQGLPAAVVGAGALVVSANSFEATGDLAALLSVQNGPVTVLGNVATGPIFLNSNPLPAPWAPLNAAP